MADTSLDGIKRRIRLTLQHGKAVGFVGWRDSYHDELTRAIPPQKVVFTDSTAPPNHVGFIFFTKTVNPSLRGKISKGRSVSHMLLDPTEIKSLLRELGSEIVPQPAPTPATTATRTADDVLDVLTQPQELGVMEKFVRAFREEAAKHNGLVGRRTLGTLIRAHSVESAGKLAAGGWIVGEVGKDKKRVGSYRAGPKMAELEQKATILPEDPLERARFLLAQKDALTVEKEKLEARLTAVKEKLDLIEKVSQAIGQLSNLLK